MTWARALHGFWAPDYRKITDIKVRQALACAYPYAGRLAATGLIADVTRGIAAPT